MWRKHCMGAIRLASSLTTGVAVRPAGRALQQPETDIAGNQRNCRAMNPWTGRSVCGRCIEARPAALLLYVLLQSSLALCNIIVVQRSNNITLASRE